MKRRDIAELSKAELALEQQEAQARILALKGEQWRRNGADQVIGVRSIFQLKLFGSLIGFMAGVVVGMLWLNWSSSGFTFGLGEFFTVIFLGLLLPLFLFGSGVKTNLAISGETLEGVWQQGQHKFIAAVVAGLVLAFLIMFLLVSWIIAAP